MLLGGAGCLLEAGVPFDRRGQPPIGLRLGSQRRICLGSTGVEHGRGTLGLRCSCSERLLSADRQCRGGGLLGASRPIRVDGDRQCLVEVVEAIPRIGGRGDRCRLEAFGAICSKR